jgi:hypothetical protein
MYKVGGKNNMNFLLNEYDYTLVYTYHTISGPHIKTEKVFHLPNKGKKVAMYGRYDPVSYDSIDRVLNMRGYALSPEGAIEKRICEMQSEIDELQHCIDKAQQELCKCKRKK